MENFFYEWFGAIATYASEANYGELIFWLPIVLPFPLVWLLAKIIHWLGPKPQHTSLIQPYHSLRATMIGSSVIACVWIAVCCYLWAIGHYREHQEEFSHLLGLLSTLIIGLIATVEVRRLFNRNNQRNLFRQPISLGHENQLLNQAKTAFRRVKNLMLIPLLGFLSLLLFQQKSFSLVSVVIDNSSSMEAGNFGEVPLEQGKEALIASFSGLDEGIDLILTTFEQPRPDQPYKSSILEITNTVAYNKLAATHVPLQLQDNASAATYFRNIGDQFTDSTPLSEATWANYLFTKEYAEREARKYDKVIQIIATDGFDNLSDANGMFCDNTNYAEFFTTPNEVHILKLTQDEASPYVNKAGACGYTIWDSYEIGSFTQSLREILQDFRKDWNFIFWMIAIYLTILLLILMSSPKR